MSETNPSDTVDTARHAAAARTGQKLGSTLGRADLLFILAPPRSFTTVVSHMLGQHPQMYGLPETHLLGAETLAEWWNLCSQATFNMDHGLLRVVAELYFGEQTEYTVKRASGWLRRRSHFLPRVLA